MSKKETEEIDLLYYIKSFKKGSKKAAISLFKGIQFIKRNWIVILVLILLGIGLGYYSKTQEKPNNEARVLVRINFDAVSAVYNIVDNINNKIINKNFGKNLEGPLRQELVKIGSIEIKPVINVREILEKYDINDRKLENIVKNLEFEFEEEDEFQDISETFRTEYRYHYLALVFDEKGTEETVEAIINYINNENIIKRAGIVGKQNLIDQLEGNKLILTQIDSVLATYNKTQPLPSPSDQIFVVDKNFNISNIIETKVELIKDNQRLNENLVYADQLLTRVSNQDVHAAEKGLLQKKMIVYPILFVFLFFLFAWLKLVYGKVKEFAQEDV